MKIGVVGAGAMGSLFGGLMAESCENVTLVDIWKEHVEAINERGLRINGVSGDRIVKVRATTNPFEVGVVDLILIFVKSYDTAQAAKNSLPLVGDETVFLSLQNGLSNIDKLAGVVGKDKVVRGVTAHGSTVLGPGKIFHAGKGLTLIGELNGSNTTRINVIAKVFNKTGIDTEITSNIQSVLWSKIMVNVGINAITALTGLKNGELLNFPEIKAVMRRAVLEAQEVAKVQGIKINTEDPVVKVFEVAEATAENRSSMLQDVDKGRKTEIAAINGSIVKLGRKYGVDTPVNEVLTAAVLGLEKIRLEPAQIKKFSK